MNHSVVWSPEAKNSFEKPVRYVEENWGRKSAITFIERVHSILSIITQHPKAFVFLPQYNAYRCVVVKQVSLFYRLQKNKIELLTFWDNRQDPQNIKL